MGEPDQNIRIIKKYPNRRLYDTHLSKYIKITDIRVMITNDVEFQVIDTDTKKDITRSVLLQIILEQESENSPLFSSENLKHFIRYYGHNKNDMFSTYMDQSLEFFRQQQEQFTDSLKQSPADSFNQFNQKNIEMWHGLQKQFFDSFTQPEPNDKDKP